MALKFPLYEYHDLSAVPGRLLAVGDIHGMFPILRRDLKRINFDPLKDRLIMLGDLVDRGHHSAESIQWVNAPGVLRVRGNHEEFLDWSVVTGDGRSGYIHEQHIKNGGAWFYDLSFEERQRYARALCDVPIALEIKTPAGHNVGFVHAEVPQNDWMALKAYLAAAKTPYDDKLHSITWGASGDVAAPYRVRGVHNIDHVFFGHIAVKDPVRTANCSWIDTKAFASARLTIVDVDEWIASRDAKPANSLYR